MSGSFRWKLIQTGHRSPQSCFVNQVLMKSSGDTDGFPAPEDHQLRVQSVLLVQVHLVQLFSKNYFTSVTPE